MPNDFRNLVGTYVLHTAVVTAPKSFFGCVYFGAAVLTGVLMISLAVHIEPKMLSYTVCLAQGVGTLRLSA